MTIDSVCKVKKCGFAAGERGILFYKREGEEKRMDRTLIWLRLGCLLFGGMAGLLWKDKAMQRFFPQPRANGARLLRLMIGVAKTVVCCAAAVVVSPLPVSVSILYAGLGVLVLHIITQPNPGEQTLPIICTWMILFLPFTGALACLGGALLVLAADVTGAAGVAILILGAPMALLQFGPEGGLVLLGVAVLLCARQMIEWKAQQAGSYRG